MDVGTLIRRVRFLLNRSKEQQDLEEEMRLHRELRARQLAGEAADQMASRLFGNQTLWKERANDMWGWNWLEDLGRDWKQTGRMLSANRGFASIAILTLALGIGANTAIFSVVNALLLQNLPVPHPQQLYRIKTDRMPWNTSNTGDPSTSFSDYVFEHLREDHHVLETLVAYVPLGYNKISVRAGALPQEAAVDLVSGNFFTGLGVRPACGRMLSSDDEAKHAPVAVVSYGYATKEFADACAAVGRPLSVKQVPLTIVGVAANGFAGVEPGLTDVWVPFQVRPEMNAWGHSGKSFLADPHWWCILLIARLQPGTTKAAAEAALNPAYQRAAYEPLGGKPAAGEHPVRLSLVRAQGIANADNIKTPLLILQVMVAMLLVIACGNVSMLLAVRNASRGREFCVRLALGGSKWRLLRQLLAESLVLVGCGTLLGLVLALFATRVLAQWAELDTIPSPDQTVLLFTLMLSVLVAIVFGLGPALNASRVSIADSIKNSAATAFRDRSRINAGNLMTAVQLAFCLALLVATGLLVRTLQNLQNVNIGFKTTDLLLFGISPQIEADDDAKTIGFYRSLISQLRLLPQVQGVTLTGNRIGSGWSNNTDVYLDGKTPTDTADTSFRWNDVGPDFFTTLGIPLLAGRDFSDGDSQKAAAVAVVNRTFVKHFLHAGNALGHTVSFDAGKPFTIVGIAEDNKYTGVQEDPAPVAWFPYMQLSERGAATVEVRTAGPPLAALPSIRKALARFAPDLALLQPRTQQAEFAQGISSQTLVAKLSFSFAVLAVLLVSIGLYGTISYSVKRRTTEVGIRVALGAEGGRVIWMILRQGLLLCALGLILGLPLVFALGHFLATLLYGVKPTDTLAIAIAALSIFVISAIATYIPARRAALIDPIKALRYE